MSFVSWSALPSLSLSVSLSPSQNQLKTRARLSLSLSLSLSLWLCICAHASPRRVSQLLSRRGCTMMIRSTHCRTRSESGVVVVPSIGCAA